MKKRSVLNPIFKTSFFSSGSFLRGSSQGNLRSYGLPIVVSLFLHLLMLGFLTNSWSDDSALKIVPPKNIRASLVELPQAKPAPEKQQPRPKPRPKVDESRKAREQAERKRQEALKIKQRREREIALQKKQEAKARREADARKERQRQEKLKQERLKKQQEALRQKLEQEQLQREQAQAAKDATEVEHYSGLFRQLVAQHWNRPPSARNNMTALLQVALSPYGDLLEVRLLESSGNDALDRSAIQAVQRAAPFPELRKLERRIFNENFRRFNFRFRPEDLVR